MKLLTEAQAGSDRKNDALVWVSPADEVTVLVQAKPIILRQFGAGIEAQVRQVAREEGVTGADIRIQDGGALDFVLRARVRCALRRAMGGART